MRANNKPRRILVLDVNEVSLTASPANPRSRVTLFKSARPVTKRAARAKPAETTLEEVEELWAKALEPLRRVLVMCAGLPEATAEAAILKELPGLADWQTRARQAVVDGAALSVEMVRELKVWNEALGKIAQAISRAEDPLAAFRAVAREAA